MKHSIPECGPLSRPLKDRVTVRHRDEIDPGSDEFLTKEGEMIRLSAGIGRTPITALPDHVGVCEVVKCGKDVKYAKEGDVCMLDFYEAEQPFMVDGENFFVIRGNSLKCWVDPKAGTVKPFPPYVLTKHAPDRMSRAVTGSDMVTLTRSETTSGIPGRKVWSNAVKGEVPCYFITYEEVVDIGSEAAAEWDIKIGDLVMIVTDFAMSFRAMGENLRLSRPGGGCINVIDDSEVIKLMADRQPAKDVRLGQTGILIL